MAIGYAGHVFAVTSPRREKAGWFHLRWKVIWIFLGLCFALGFSVVAVAVFSLTRDPDPSQLAGLPAGCGAKGPDFKVACPDGIPLLLVRGLPYTSSFDSVWTQGGPVSDFPLNGEWDWHLGDEDSASALRWRAGQWSGEEIRSIAIPSTYNATQSPYKGHQGVSWFRRIGVSPGIPSGWKRRLRFDGVLLRSCVWLNRKFLGCHEGGYTPFRFEITGLTHADGPDTLVVRADNRLTWHSLPPRIRVKHNPVWGVYGGIYRGAAMETAPPSRLLKALPQPYRGEKDSGFALEAVVSLADSGAWTLRTTWSDSASGKAGSASTALAGKAGLRGVVQRLPIAGIRVWRPHAPETYRLRLDLMRGDSLQASWWLTTGYRNVEVTPSDLLINGKPRFLKGIAMMEDDPRLGQSQDAYSVARDMGWVDSLRADFVRLAHYPHHGATLEWARDNGVMVSEEIPYFHVGEGWSQWMVDFQEWKHFPATSFGMRQLRNRRLLLLAQRSLLEMIERDAANPAVILWSLGNESFDLGHATGEIYGWLRKVARAVDSTRPVYMAEMTYYQGWLDALRHGSDSLDIVAINAYYGWYFGEAREIGDQLDALHARYPGKPILITECGAEAGPGRFKGAPVRKGDRVFFDRPYTEDYQAEVLAAHWEEARKRPYVVGMSPWVLFDFYCPWFPHNPVPETNNKGLLTRERKPKLGFRRLQAIYRDAPDRL